MVAVPLEALKLSLRNFQRCVFSLGISDSALSTPAITFSEPPNFSACHMGRGGAVLPSLPWNFTQNLVLSRVLVT